MGSAWSLFSHSLFWQFLKPSLRKVFEFLRTKHICLGYFPWFHYKCLVSLFSWPAPMCHFDLTSSREALTLKIWRTHHHSITPLFPREQAQVSLSGVMISDSVMLGNLTVSFSSGVTPPSAQSYLNMNIWVILM